MTAENVYLEHMLEWLNQPYGLAAVISPEAEKLRLE